MKGLIRNLLLAWICLECTSLMAQPESIREMFQDQLNQSCFTNGALTKTYTDLNTASHEPEIQALRFPGDTADCSLETDLYYAVEKLAWDPRQKEYYDFVQNGDTLVAQVKAGKEDAVELKVQKAILSGGNIRYLESRIEKDYWLYDNNVHIQVSFDPGGRYESHDMVIRTVVIGIGKTLNAAISGKANYQ